jgi:hypothetical protein
VLTLTEPSKGSFFASHILPQINEGKIEGNKADVLAIEILRNLGHLENEHPGNGMLY